mgnify:CR=1 FL=1
MTEKIREQLSLSKWTLKEALNNSKGKSSIGLFLAFAYGLACIILSVYSGFTQYNDGLMFVGTQMPFIFGYLGYRVHSTKTSADPTEAAQDAD